MDSVVFVLCTFAVFQLGEPGWCPAQETVHHLHCQAPGLGLAPEQRQTCPQECAYWVEY